MGCFDVMCSASNTPISYGDRIVMLYAAFVNPFEKARKWEEDY